MRAKFYVFIFAVMLSFFIAAQQVARGEEKPDTCLTLFIPHNPDKGYYNPDSVLIDTCDKETDYWYYKIYAKEWFKILFDVPAIILPAYPMDTIIFVTYNDVDTLYPEIITGLKRLDTLFGSYVMKKKHPQYDTSDRGSQVFLISFENYQKVIDVERYLKSIEYTYLWETRYVCRTGVEIDNSVKEETEKNDLEIYPNPFQNILKIKYYTEEYSKIVIKLIDILGNNYKILENTYKDSGEYEIIFDGSNLPAGIYYLIFQIDSKKYVQKVIKY